MPKKTKKPRPKKEEGAPWYIWALLGLLAILLLKTFRVLPDPPEYLEILAGIGATVGVVGSFGILFNKMFGFENRLSTAETKLETISKDITEVKNDFKEIRDTMNQIKGKLGLKP